MGALETSVEDAASVAVQPILDLHLDDVGAFLHQHMNSKFSPKEWCEGISANWLEDAPNHGFMLTVGDEIVGVLCAIYSLRYVGTNESVRICNPHSWCVLSSYRKKSIELVTAAIRQENYHFTMFSPNRDGIQIFTYLRFKQLDDRIRMLINVPLPWTAGRVHRDEGKNGYCKSLPSESRRHLVDHQRFHWLKFLGFSRNGQYGFLIFKPTKYKRLPCADIIYVSNKELFKTVWGSIRRHLFVSFGFVTSRIESRILGGDVSFSFDGLAGPKKFYLSDRLVDDDIDNIYSELVALDL